MEAPFLLGSAFPPCCGRACRVHDLMHKSHLHGFAFPPCWAGACPRNGFGAQTVAPPSASPQPPAPAPTRPRPGPALADRDIEQDIDLVTGSAPEPAQRWIGPPVRAVAAAHPPSPATAANGWEGSPLGRPSALDADSLVSRHLPVAFGLAGAQRSTEEAMRRLRAVPVRLLAALRCCCSSPGRAVFPAGATGDPARHKKVVARPVSRPGNGPSRRQLIGASGVASLRRLSSTMRLACSCTTPATSCTVGWSKIF